MVMSSIVGLSASLRTPSRTTALMIEVLGQVAAARRVPARLIELAGVAPELARARKGEPMTAHVREVIAAVEAAHLLVVGAPVYRATVTTVARDLFDLIPAEALRSKPVLLVAIGGEGPRALIPEVAFRPLSGLALAAILPIGVHATEEDFDGTRPTGVEIPARIARAVAQFRVPSVTPARMAARA